MEFYSHYFADRIFDLNYDILVNKQETVTKNLIQHLGIEWDNTFLFPEKNQRSVRTASNLQVRKRVYKGSSSEWEKYKPFLDQIESFSHIASGSYHGALVCAMLDISFSMWPSNTHKMIALANDMGVRNIHYTNKSDAINSIPETNANSIKEYVADGQNKINEFFNNLNQYV